MLSILIGEKPTMTGHTNVLPRRFPQRCYHLLSALVAVIIIFSSPALAQQEDDDEPAPATIPNTPAGHQLKWVLEVVNGRDLGDPNERFTERFQQMLPEGGLKAALTTLRTKSFDGAKVVLHRVLSDGGERPDTVTAVVRGEGTKRLLAVFLVTDEKTGKISGLRFAPAGSLGGDPGDWNSFEGDLGKLQGGVSFGAYELVPKDPANPKGELKLKPVYEFGEEKRLAIGSTFKLYVLGTLAEKVAKGEVKWDDKLPIKEAWKSLPSGVMQNEADGKEIPISEFIEKMISISDNTAADHLLRKVGRDKVEEYMGRLNEGAEHTRPFLTTQEMFTIKLNKDKSLVDRYAAANEEKRRAMLAEGGEAAKGLDVTRAAEWKLPIQIDNVEWFATAPECCQVMADLRRIEQLPGMEPMSKALRINPGMPFDEKVWKSVAFKGGSEPGVMNLTFLLERKDNRWFALSVGWNDSEKALDEARLVELAGKGVAILEKDGNKEGAKDGAKDAPPAKAPGGKKKPGPIDDGN
jgi:beta-lactamase class A